MTSGLETEWDYSGRKGRDGQMKKIGKANERKGSKRGKRWTRGKRGAPAPHGAVLKLVLILCPLHHKWQHTKQNSAFSPTFSRTFKFQAFQV